MPKPAYSLTRPVMCQAMPSKVLERPIWSAVVAAFG